MTPFWTLVGLAFCGPLAIVVTARSLRRAMREIRAHREAADIARIEAGFRSWAEPTPPQPLRAIAWPVRQSPTDMAPVYEPVWSPPDWARSQLRDIVWAVRRYEELVAA